ncbi:hypothetical protein [Bacillus sp. FJAT-49736]|uniref:hypothetical protein n=1 Tax=Bacillus sp. FJAT-49736 TaxID=2833582 RepID=UPI001BC8E376|nr:hypothetical protein [Bacillus sp. FJAT-49736]MBS4174738.1 hypothetical protein [Bacillus sp. FJAT-49736]
MDTNLTRINLGDLIIVNADHSSTISLGSTVQINKNVSAKKNQAIGQKLGDFSGDFFSITKIMDDDVSDFVSLKQSDIE